MLNPFRVFPVVTVKEGLAVQSYSYESYRPLGNPVVLVENFDRWQVNEILVNCIDATPKLNEPNFSLIEELAALKINTPLTYGGGIKTVEHGVKLITSGCDRLLIESGFWAEPKVYANLSEILGKQALILSIPLLLIDGEYFRYDYLSGNVHILKEKDLSLIDEIFSEVILVDKVNEGHHKSYSIQPDCLNFGSTGKILFGGISVEKQISKYAQNSNINACAIGNFSSHKELFLSSFNNFMGRVK